MKLQSHILSDGVLSHLGNLNQRQMILFIGRSNHYKNSHPLQKIIPEINLTRYTLVWYESNHSIINARLDDQYDKHIKRFAWLIPNSFTALGGLGRKLYKAGSSLFRSSYWSYFASRFKDPIHLQTLEYEQAMTFLGVDKHITIMSHSAGGRIALALAKLPTVKKLICFGYPFQNPQYGPEPSRTMPLQFVDKPFLIIQGKHDEYGGWDIQDRYPLSEQIKLVLIDSDHEYAELDSAEWELVTNEINYFLNFPAP